MGERYYITFMDDFTHFTVVYPLKHKSDALMMFKKYEALATTHFSNRLVCLRCDNGGEYTSKIFLQLCEDKGIQLQCTTPYTPQQNGLAERLNRTITEKCRTLLLDSGLNKELWNEAIRTSAYILNRSPTTALHGKTPFEM